MKMRQQRIEACNDLSDLHVMAGDLHVMEDPVTCSQVMEGGRGY